ncbi:MAG: restriction endonuclease [Verrucomicrobia bacterium]|nr:restriction endonuclease [Verrucomicrobiota bacterium]
MARRRKGGDFDLVRGILALVFLGAFAFVGFDLKKLASFGVLLATGVVGLVLVAGAFAFVFLVLRSSGSRPSGHRKTSFDAYPLRVEKDGSPSARDFYTPVPTPPPDLFTLELVKSMEWRHFELLAQGLFRALGLHAQRIKAGGDGGIDLVLREGEYGPVVAIVQCKAWTNWQIPPKTIRELYGAMAAEGAPHGYFICSGKFSGAAREWAQGKALTLVDGEELVVWLNSLDYRSRVDLIREITTGDYKTPTCPQCEISLVKRSGQFGEFWGCPNYGNRARRCRYKMPVARRAA